LFAAIIARRPAMHHRPFIAALACLGLPLLAGAQSPELKLPSFASLQQKATESVDITIGSLALGIMSRLIDNDDEDSADVKKALKRLKAVQIRSYQFASDFAYSTADIEAVRSQLSGPGWTPLTQVHDRKKNEDVDIYVALDAQKITGFAIISTEPREFTILNIVGAVDLKQFAKLQKQLGLPGATVARLPAQLL
jgi:Domain of unknown function (DUF4252)